MKTKLAKLATKYYETRNNGARVKYNPVGKFTLVSPEVSDKYLDAIIQFVFENGEYYLIHNDMHSYTASYWHLNSSAHVTEIISILKELSETSSKYIKNEFTFFEISQFNKMLG